MFKPFERLIKSVFPSSFNPRANLEELCMTDPNLSKKSSVETFIRVIKNSLKNSRSQHELIQILLEKLEDGTMKLSNVLCLILPLFTKFEYNEKTSTTIMDLVNFVLFRFHEISTNDGSVFLDCLLRFVESIGSWNDLTVTPRRPLTERQRVFMIQESRVKHLVRIYFGILYWSCANPNYQLRCMSLRIFNSMLRILEPSLTDMETTFHFSEKRNFMKVVMRYKRRTLFISEENIFSRFYFKLIAQLQTEYFKDADLHSRIPNALEWSEGSLLSVYGSIRKDRCFVLAKEPYLQALCEIAMRKGPNYLLALYVIKRIYGKSDFCAYYFNKFFVQKKGIDLDRIFGLLDDKFNEDVFNYLPMTTNQENVLKSCLVQSNLNFKNNLLKCRSFGLVVKTCCGKE